MSRGVVSDTPKPDRHYYLNKTWNEDFEKDQNFKDDSRWVEGIERLRAEDDQSRSAEEDQSRSAEEDQSRSGEEDQSRSGEEDQSRSGEEDQSRRAEDDQNRSGEDDQNGSGEDDQSRRAEDDQDIARVMRETLNTEQSYLYRRVEAYCYGARIEDVRNGIGAAWQRHAAWLDDRTFGIPDSGGRGSRRPYWRSASELLQDLYEKVRCRYRKLSI